MFTCSGQHCLSALACQLSSVGPFHFPVPLTSPTPLHPQWQPPLHLRSGLTVEHTCDSTTLPKKTHKAEPNLTNNAYDLLLWPEAHSGRRSEHRTTRVKALSLAYKQNNAGLHALSFNAESTICLKLAMKIVFLYIQLEF